MYNFTMIYASDDNDVIGNVLELPAWDAPEDMKHFRTYTKGKIVIMGRKTADSLGKPLPGRMNIVLSLSKTGEENGFHYTNGITGLDKLIPEDRKEEEIIIMGGAEIYKSYEPIANKIMLSKITGSYGKGEGDVTYKVNMIDDWVSKELSHSTDKVKFYELTRKEVQKKKGK
jgi:dihydrofolate reductase